MSHTLIETYGQTGETVMVAGRSFPHGSLIEDDDGLRWLLLDGLMHIDPAHYAQAVASGAVALAAPLHEGGWAAVTVEAFMEYRTESSGRYHLVSGWWEFPGFPAYPDLMATLSTPTVESEPQVDEAPTPVEGFVHLHVHSEFSKMDGRSRIPEIMTEVVRHGQSAVALTDHGAVPGHPMLQAEADKVGVKPIFGMEAYFVHDRFRRPVEWWEDAEGHRVSDEVLADLTIEQRKKTLTRVTDVQEVRYGYFHLTLLAQDNAGLRNLWGMSTEGYREGKYDHPRIDWDTLVRHAEGIVCLTGCLRGPLAVPVLDHDLEAAQSHLGRLMDIFGDRLYLEVMPNDMPEQVTVNQAMADFARQYDLPLVATVDSHYPTDDARPEHQAWVAASTAKDLQDETDLFAKDLGLYVKSEDEVRKGLLLSLAPDEVDQSIANTVRIAHRCTARIEAKTTIPVFARGPESAEIRQKMDEDRLFDLCMANWHLTLGTSYTQDEAIARFEHEFPMIVSKGYCGYFLQVADYCGKMRAEGCRIGPGRGSGGGSLVAYLARITGLDPIECGLLFERFMTEGRTALPDFDIDFPTSWRHRVQDYITHRYGEDKVVRVGTHLRLKNKGIIKKLGMAMKSQLPETAWKDLEEVSKIIGDAEAATAGIGLSWEELWAQEGEVLQPYVDRYPALFAMAEKLVGILHSYGKHAAGLVVSTDESLIDSLPLWDSDEDQMITQFDMDALEALGYIKFDILTLRTLDTIQASIDLVKTNRGHTLDVDNWREEYLDPQVWEALSEGHTLGVFQVETPSGTRLIKQVRPTNLAEFADVLTLVRPGPKRSGLQDLYLVRHHGDAEVTFPDPRLATVLSKTYGCILYQEDVMQTTMVLAGYDSTKADEVRKILGKKQVEKVVSAGREFIEGCVENGMDRDPAERLWEQMAEFAKYSFNRAHAYGYGMLAYWTAWLKVHYPVEFYTSVLSTVDDKRVPEFVNEARRMGLSILPPDVNASGRTFTCEGLSVRYGLEAIPSIGKPTAALIIGGQPYSSYEDFRERSGAHAGVVATLAKIGAFDSLVPNRRGLETLLLRDKTGESTQCLWKDPDCGTGPQGVCTFPWAQEPVPINERTGKLLKPKPIPKRCTKACRNYKAPGPIDISIIPAYTSADIRNIEMETLGLHLSSTVFDQMDDEERQWCLAEADRFLDGPPDNYILAVTITKVRKHVDRNKNQMAFLGMVTERGDVDVVVFSKVWEKHERELVIGSLCLVEVNKNDRGCNLLYVNKPTVKPGGTR